MFARLTCHRNVTSMVWFSAFWWSTVCLTQVLRLLYFCFVFLFFFSSSVFLFSFFFFLFVSFFFILLPLSSYLIPFLIRLLYFLFLFLLFFVFSIPSCLFRKCNFSHTVVHILVHVTMYLDPGNRENPLNGERMVAPEISQLSGSYCTRIKRKQMTVNI